jgi:adenylyltransferase/sulfurtransferase
MKRELPQLAPALLRQCFAHALAEYPNEACGLLSGPIGQPSSLRVCENDQDRLHALDPIEFPSDGRTAYRLRFGDVRWLLESLRSQEPVQVVFHSHIDVGADFSADDRRVALSDGQPLYPVDHLIVDVCASGVRGAKLFRFSSIADAGDFALVAEYDAEGQLKAR